LGAQPALSEADVFRARLPAGRFGSLLSIIDVQMLNLPGSQIVSFNFVNTTFSNNFQMTARILTIISLLFFSCNNEQAKKQNVSSLPTNDSKVNEIITPKVTEKQEVNTLPDTTSSDYLIYLLKNEKDLNNYWTQKLKKLDAFALPLDSMSHLSLKQTWEINDSISVIIVAYAFVNDYDEFLLTVKNKKEFVSKIHVSDQADSDLSPGHPYYYTEYKLIDNRKVKLVNHKITGTEGGEENDKILSIENWTIQSDGQVLKK
jgi:hypothetical protein